MIKKTLRGKVLRRTFRVSIRVAIKEPLRFSVCEVKDIDCWMSYFVPEPGSVVFFLSDRLMIRGTQR